ncbi:MipA/OmpV family protein [Sphingomonas sp. Tas61C01]|uniref:MipA/OmpV family protein n=1 Tax=Sphingomonas sp. Tas61C01 TaxID=3458297 RepID=UPI00403E3814
MIMRTILTATASLATLSTAATAQDAPAKRTRIAAGPQIGPSYPGADGVSFSPLFDLSRAKAGEDFAFEAADESIGSPLVRLGGASFGPAFGFQGSRTARDVGAPVRKVGFTVEAGGFVQYQFTPAIRGRAELRKGIGGHRGWVSDVSMDYVVRDHDRSVFSIGPRVTISDDRYNRAYFGVSPTDAAATGLSRFKASGGIQAVGATAGLIRQITPVWGFYSYASYDRLVSDAARSPLVRAYGSRDQFSGGVALTYTFAAKR